MIKEIKELQKEIDKIIKKEMREQNLLVAQFIKKFPDIPINEIVLVTQQLPNGYCFRVTSRISLELEQKGREWLGL